MPQCATLPLLHFTTNQLAPHSLAITGPRETIRNLTMPLHNNASPQQHAAVQRYTLPSLYLISRHHAYTIRRFTLPLLHNTAPCSTLAIPNVTLPCPCTTLLRHNSTPPYNAMLCHRSTLPDLTLRCHYHTLQFQAPLYRYITTQDSNLRNSTPHYHAYTLHCPTLPRHALAKHCFAAT